MGNSHPLFAALYDRLVAPAERAGLDALRARLLGELRGTVLEIGAGTGLNLRHYRHVERLILVEPDPAMLRRLQARVAGLTAASAVESLEVAAEQLPLADASVDAAVSTLSLCSVADPDAVLAELRRVLRPGAPLVLIEHVRASSVMSGALQTALTPVQRLVAGGCHLNRPTRAALRRAGFDDSAVEDIEMPGGTWPLRAAIAGHAIAS